MNTTLNVEEMSLAGLQFGHKKSKIHPKMKPFLYGIRNTIYIIDLQKTIPSFEAALAAVKKIAAEGKTIIFVGTKLPFKKITEETAIACGFPYATERWLGGTFTNFPVIKKRIEYFKDLEKKRDLGEFEKYTKKEQTMINKELKDLERKFGGIKNMDQIPGAIFMVDMEKDKLAVKEARENGVTVIGITDVNIDPSIADYPIIANDDSLSSVSYILDKVKTAILEGQEALAAAAVK